jgi:hypothetical protein
MLPVIARLSIVGEQGRERESADAALGRREHREDEHGRDE